MRRGSVLAIALPLAACGLSVEGVARPVDGGVAGDGDSSGDASDGRTNDPGHEVDGAADAGPDAPAPPACKGTAGPSSIVVGSYCIDRTEVTRAQYAAFVAAGSTVAQPAYCAWNASFETVLEADELPMTFVDWCDARAFCAWAGKRLCTADESRNACASAGRKYPYGATYVAGRCNDVNAVKGAPVAVGSLTCTSELGVHDMIGNVWEWIDKCTGTTGANDPCSFNTGGAFSHKYDCDQTASGFVRQSKSLDVGFRCCADLQ